MLELEGTEQTWLTIYITSLESLEKETTYLSARWLDHYTSFVGKSLHVEELQHVINTL